MTTIAHIDARLRACAAWTHAADKGQRRDAWHRIDELLEERWAAQRAAADAS